MKPSQRSFVVEIKSTRRRSKMPPKSIWGDTDFTALAREAEAMHLSTRPAVPGALSQCVDQPSGPQAVAEPARIVEIPTAHHVAGPLVEANLTHAEPSEQGLTDNAPVEKEMDAPETSFPNPVKRRRARKVKANADVENLRLDVTGPAHDLGRRDELALLEDENRYLKLRLAEQLHRQNLELRQKLERFGSN